MGRFCERIQLYKERLVLAEMEPESHYGAKKIKGQVYDTTS